MDDEVQPGVLTREQKAGFFLLLIFGVLAVGLGFFQLRNTIYEPFIVHKNPKTLTIAVDESVRLKQSDTDHDGLNDYDELNVYHTSPYVVDTDSDTLSDNVEVDKGTDPLCAEGADCTSNALSIDNTNARPELVKPLASSSFGALDIIAQSLGQITATSSVDAGMPNPAIANPSSALDIGTLANNPALLRKLLLEGGEMTAAELNNITDSQLLQIAAQFIVSSTPTVHTTSSAR